MQFIPSVRVYPDLALLTGVDAILVCFSRSSSGRPNSDHRRRGSRSARYIPCANMTLKREHKL